MPSARSGRSPMTRRTIQLDAGSVFGRNAQTPVIRPQLGERVKSTPCGHSRSARYGRRTPESGHRRYLQGVASSIIKSSPIAFFDPAGTVLGQSARNTVPFRAAAPRHIVDRQTSSPTAPNSASLLMGKHSFRTLLYSASEGRACWTPTCVRIRACRLPISAPQRARLMLPTGVLSGDECRLALVRGQDRH